MSEAGKEYRFVIEAYSPETMPMLRLAEYMTDLARIFGENEYVHFVRLERGSTVLVQAVDPDVEPKMRGRLRAIASGEPPEDAARAFGSLNGRLAADGATGSLQDGDGAEVIRFPGRERSRNVNYGPHNQSDTLDGTLIRIGSRDDTVPVHLKDDDTIHMCNATRSMAKDLAPYLYGPVLRVHGDARWERNSDGQWLLERFNIKKFEELEDVPVSEVVDRLRRIEGSNWKNIEDPAGEIQRLRSS